MKDLGRQGASGPSSVPAALTGGLDILLARYRTQRTLGLDILRIVAAFTIVAHHGNIERAVGVNVASAIIWHKGYLAVDIFMVLSGWLLTRQAFHIVAGSRDRARFAVTFWVRRWARTLPAYWAMLIGLFSFTNMSFLALLKHAAFMQTVFPPNLYNVSWSLVAEEWFYLSLPCVLLIALRPWNRKLLVLAAVGALLMPSLVRAAMLRWLGFDYPVHLQPQGHFDGLVVGAMCAGVAVKSQWWHDWALAHRRALLALGLGGIAVVLVGPDYSSWLFRVPGLLLFCLCMGCLMPFMSSLKWPRWAPPSVMIGTAFVSELTYSMYLVHMFTLDRIHWVTASGAHRIVDLLGSVALLFGCATGLHLFVERPFLALRDRVLNRTLGHDCTR